MKMCYLTAISAFGKNRINCYSELITADFPENFMSYFFSFFPQLNKINAGLD